jgi:hypothetical protein
MRQISQMCRRATATSATSGETRIISKAGGHYDARSGARHDLNEVKAFNDILRKYRERQSVENSPIKLQIVGPDYKYRAFRMGCGGSNLIAF